MSTRRQLAYRESFRQDILDAARQLFVVHGYEATSVRSIASKVGASPGILYHYFEDKQDIMAHLVRETFAKLGARLNAIRQDQDTVQARMQRGLRSYIDFGLENPHHYALLFMKATILEEHEKIRMAFFEEGQRTFDCLRSMSAEAIAANVIRPEIQDTEELAQSLWVAVHGFVSAQISMEKFPWIERTRLADRLIDVLMAGILRT